MSEQGLCLKFQFRKVFRLAAIKLSGNVPPKIAEVATTFTRNLEEAGGSKKDLL
jgi:hypothetical protein